MSLDQLLARMARRERRLWRTVCRIDRPGRVQGRSTFDPATKSYDEPPPTPVYEGVCSPRRLSQGVPGDAEAGGEPATVSGYVVKVPLDAGADVGGVAVGDIWTCVRSKVPGLAERLRLRVAAVVEDDRSPVLRLVCEATASSPTPADSGGS